jgi:hypothetical protein
VSHEAVDLAEREAQAGDVDAQLSEISNFEGQEIHLPPRPFGELVVGDDQRPLVSLGEMRELDHGHGCEAELARCGEPAMSGDDAVSPIDEDRVGEAEAPDRACYERDLLIGVGASIPGIGDQGRDRPGLDPEPQARHERHEVGRVLPFGCRISGR